MFKWYLLFISLVVQSASAQKASPGNAKNAAGDPAIKWPTLSGNRPIVVARGGFSGIFPDSSEYAVDMAMTSSMDDIVMYCDLQLTKDGMGICQPDLTLDNNTDIAMIFPTGKKTYNVNGKPVDGWFAVDYTFDQLYNNITLVQNVLSRPSLFDGTMPIQSVDDILGRKSVKVLWLNVQHDMFYNQQKHSPSTYLQKYVLPTATAMPPNPAKPKSGIFSFDVSWNEIQTLKPQIENPYDGDSGYPRDIHNKNKGKFVTLDEFLEFAKKNAVSGILINIEASTCSLSLSNAAYLASKKGLDIVGSVSKALNKATFDKEATRQVLIQSDDTSVLSQFSNIKSYKRFLTIKEKISDAPKASVDAVKKHADGVFVSRSSLIPTTNGFLIGNTSVVTEMHAANLSVYVSVFKNEYLALAFDYYSDPVLELATYVVGMGVDGVVTDFPATATRYMRSRCFDINGDQAILPIQPGSLMDLVEGAGPPAEAPAPALDVSDVVDPPLPPVATANASDSATATAAPPKSGSSANSAHLGYSLVALVLLKALFSV
ncbi:hypothetical protein SAY86_022560 [Trapa natans]|uniref:glycerophosphodiester phosphodiesterase n=1 Tax=Trapa natans TaxID=22666 RepID=A0AAN7R8H8_TRANT|nr:hypothetical protein SAY86_022560 [Trapa natans]